MSKKLKRFRVRVRHSPMPLKLIHVMASDEDEALLAFVTANEKHTAQKFKGDSVNKMLHLIQNWDPDGSNIEVVEVK